MERKTYRAAKVVISLLALMFLSSTLLYPQPQEKDKALRSQIILLNLVNGLYLSPKQIDIILKNAKEASRLKDELDSKIKSYTNLQQDTLEEIKGELTDYQGSFPESLGKEFHTQKGRIEELRCAYMEKLETLAENIKKNLTENQLYTIDTFKPCIVPPKGPGRIGQAEGHLGISKRLEKIRDLSQQEYNRKKYEFADKMVKKVKMRIPPQVKVDEEQIRQDILSMLDETRQLSSAEFLLRKDELAKELKEKILPTKDTIDLNYKIGRFFLNPEAVEVLEKLKAKGN